VKPVETPEEVFRIAFGYMASKALFAGAHLRVFDELARGPKSLEQLAKATGADARSLSTLLTALVSVGLLEKLDGPEAGFRNAPASQTMLVSGPEGGFADYCRHQVDRQMYPFLHNIADVLRGHRDTVPFEDYEAWFGDAAEASLYSESQHAASLPAAALLAAMVDLSGCQRLLDVGGGSGAFAITLCRMHPALRAVVLDFPNVVEVGRRFVERAGLGDRIDFVEGNALEVSWPGEQDAVLFSYVSGSVSSEGVRELYRRAYRALQPGGIVLVHDFMVDDDREGPMLPALWAFQHAAFTPGAVGLTPGLVTGLMRESGFEDLSVDPFVPEMTRLVRGRKSP
jgi:ubiquinone/menaquinone biosynthesis C-methylase UbiE